MDFGHSLCPAEPESISDGAGLKEVSKIKLETSLPAKAWLTNLFASDKDFSIEKLELPEGFEYNSPLDKEMHTRLKKQ